MNSPTPRRPLRLRMDPAGLESKPWCVRTVDGHIRGPVGFAGLQSLLEVGLIDATSLLSPIDTEDWRRITDHPVWHRLKPTASEFTFHNSGLSAESAPPMAPSRLPSSSAREAAVQLETARQGERRKTARLIELWYLGRTFGALREVLVFLAFVTLADLAASFLDGSLVVVRWSALLGLTFCALAYYTYRGLMR